MSQDIRQQSMAIADAIVLAEQTAALRIALTVGRINCARTSGVQVNSTNILDGIRVDEIANSSVMIVSIRDVVMVRNVMRS